MPTFEEIAPGQVFADYAFDRNPAVAALRKSNPAIAQAAASEAPTPTLFDGGDLPPFTASGVDPQMLLRVPWVARHPIAAASRETAFALMQDYASDPDGALMDLGGHQGNLAYIQRVFDWASGRAAPVDDFADFTRQHLGQPAASSTAPSSRAVATAAVGSEQSDLQRIRREQLVDAAVADGRLVQSARQSWLRKLEDDPANERWLAMLAPNEVIASRNAGGQGPSTKEQLDEQLFSKLFPDPDG